MMIVKGNERRLLENVDFEPRRVFVQVALTRLWLRFNPISIAFISDRDSPDAATAHKASRTPPLAGKFALAQTQLYIDTNY